MDRKNREDHRIPCPPPLPVVSKNILYSNKYNLQPKGKRFLKELQFKLVGAIESNNTHEVVNIIRKGVDLNCVILIHKTPLIYAIERLTSNPVIPEILIEAGAIVDSPEKVARNRRPLHVAVMTGSLTLVNKLLRFGANIDSRDGSNMTALHYASYYGFQDIASELISRQPRNCIHFGDVTERSPIHRAIESKHYDVAELLIQNGADVNISDINGWTPLYQCLVFDDVKGLKYLLNRGADVNHVDCKGNTPLHVACNPLGREFIRCVSSTSMDYYKRTRRIPTSEVRELFLQEQDGSLKTVQILVNAGADVTTLNNCGQLPAQITKLSEIIIYLIACGCRIHADIGTNLEQSGETEVWTSNAFTQQTRLIRQCRNIIRRSLRSSGDIHCAVNKLPLPRTLIEFIDLVHYET